MQRVLDITYRSLLCDNEIVIDMSDAEQADRWVPVPFTVMLKQGPVGLLGTRPFCVPHFFDYRKQASFSLHDLPWVPYLPIWMGRFKQLLIREGRWWETREKYTQSRAALGQVPVSPSLDTHNNIFELFCRYWNFSRSDKLTINDGRLSTIMSMPD